MRTYHKSLLFNIRRLTIFFSLVNLLPCNAQPGQWTWIKGSSSPNSYGNHGTQGIPSSTNEPPAEYEPCEWKDLNGNFWFYGGVEQYASSGNGFPTINDLWKYNPLTNEWTWVSGTNALNDPGNFGVKGIASSTNHPPALGWGVLSWTDLNGDLWMFGGYGTNGAYSDLWKYNISTNEWTWMKGPGIINQLAVYGTKMIPDTANNPPSIAENVASWTDLNGNLWFYDNSNMWSYNISTNTWTWMKGSGSLLANGNWGTLGIEDSLNEPSYRATYSHWIDNSGNFWLFGGEGWDSSGNNGFMQDMWKFSTLSNNWTWMNGSHEIVSSFGYHGIHCLTDSLNQPPGRKEARSVWKDMLGNLWLFGGYRTDSIHNASFNDLWKYCVNTNRWTWISGSDTLNSISSYGTLGVSSPNNQPPSRFGAVGWSDDNGHLYLFGGNGSVTSAYDFNDLWKFEIDTTCAPCATAGQLPQPAFILSDTSFCSGTCVNFTNQTQNATSYLWSFPGGIPSSATSATPPAVCYLNSGNFNVTLIAQNSFGSNTFSANNLVTVYPQIQFNSIVQNGDTLFSIQGYNNYQWYLDTTLIPGATNYFYVATQSGNYSVQVIDSNGCSALATLIGVVISIEELSIQTDFDVRYFSGHIHITLQSHQTSTLNIEIFNSTGAIVYSENRRLIAGKNEIESENLFLASGVYLVKLFHGNQALASKLIIQ